MANLKHPFESLTPDFILDAIESRGFVCDGCLLALNSYENRVYQIGLEQAEPIVAKFYRPDRWTDEQILEEHRFCYELLEQELPVVAPLLQDQQSLFTVISGTIRFRFALFPRRGGHAPELDNLDNLCILGRLLGRIHRIGNAKPFQDRPQIDIQSYGYDAADFISKYFIPDSLKQSYQSITQSLLTCMDAIFARLTDIQSIRVHGDCHVGNMLWRDDNPHFVDFDDARMAPAIQDIWMLLSGDRSQQTVQLMEIVEAYNEFHEFDPRELHLVESLRTLRMLYYSAWLARRWDDPAFPRSFPWFNTQRYWEEQILYLREQRAALDEEPLSIL
ncbi:MAG: serine/threonine protein kinase [Gammaproteobacteria bacterium]|nr:serine/threonine protein kinase [Gammaproteobacteria bacterium]